MKTPAAATVDEPQAAAGGYAKTLNQQATKIGLPPPTLEALVRKGKGPRTFKIGRRVYCLDRDFHAWLDDVAAGKVEATLYPIRKRRRLGTGIARLRNSESAPAA